MADGVMRMRPLKDGLELKPGETVELKSSSFHLMMVGLKQQLQQGQRIKGTLIFEKAGPVDVEYVVEGIGGAARCRARQRSDAHEHALSAAAGFARKLAGASQKLAAG